jgi:hypothetical protein
MFAKQRKAYARFGAVTLWIAPIVILTLCLTTVAAGQDQPPPPPLEEGVDPAPPQLGSGGGPGFGPGPGGERRGPMDEGQGHKFRGRHGGRPPRALWERMDEGERQRVLTFIKDRFPLMFDELEDLRERSPERFNHRMGRMAPEMIRLMEMLEVDPERARLLIKERFLDMKIRWAVRAVRHAEDDGAREEAIEELRELIAQAFDNRLERRKIEIRDLEARVQELRDRLEEAEQDREQIIENEVEDIVKGDWKGKRKGRRMKRDMDRFDDERAPRGRRHRGDDWPSPPPPPDPDQPPEGE